VPSLHPDLASGLDMATYQTEIFESSSLQSVASKPKAEQRVAAAALYAWIYPNLMINRYGSMMDINRVTPLGASRCRVDFDWYFEADCSEVFVDRALHSSDRVQQEDTTICEALQRGMASMHYRPGPYAPRVEMAKLHFHRMLAADYSRAQ
jgi:choline monooxygenase